MTFSRLVTGALLFGAAAAHAGPNEIVGIRHWSQHESTRVVIEFSEEFEFTRGRLSSPDRIFFDVGASSVRIDGTPKRAATVAVSDGFVKQVRTAETKSGVFRIVFDMAKEGAQYTVSELANPPRLAVELRMGNVPATNAAVATVAAVIEQPPSPAASAPRVSLDQMRREAAHASATGKITQPPAAMPFAAKAGSVLASPMSAAPLPLATPPAPRPSNVQAARQPSRSLTRTLGLKIGKIVIDPGHGGYDLGTTSRTGLHEKDVVLDISKRLGEILANRLGAEVAYTRTEDIFIPLEKRTAFANGERADLFLSIHANSSRLRNISGPETFYLSFSTSKESLELAAAENATSERTVFELQDLVRKITLHDKVEESRDFAVKVQAGMKALGPSNRKDRGVKRAPFVVLIGAGMPSILAEVGFLSNSREEALLKTPQYRQRVAEALAKGVEQYAATLSRMDVALAAGSAPDAQ